jgi:hypothetical protein
VFLEKSTPQSVFGRAWPSSSSSRWQSFIGHSLFLNRSAPDARRNQPDQNGVTAMNPVPLRKTSDPENEGPTPAQLADRYAALAVKCALQPTPDGLDILAGLARTLGKPTSPG